MYFPMLNIMKSRTLMNDLETLKTNIGFYDKGWHIKRVIQINLYGHNTSLSQMNYQLLNQS